MPSIVGGRLGVLTMGLFSQIPEINWDYTKLKETIDTITGETVRRRAQHVILYDAATGNPTAAGGGGTAGDSAMLISINNKLIDVFPPGTSTLDLPVQASLTTTARALMGAGTTCRSLQIQSIKPDGTANTGQIAIGTSTRQTVYLSPGEVWGDSAPLGKLLDLSQIFVRSLTAGDCITLVVRS